MTPGWWAAALLALAAPAPTAPSLAAWHGEWSGEGTAFGKAATATLVIAPAREDGETALAYHLSIAGTPPFRYAADATYRVDDKGRVRGSWTDSSGRTRPVGGRFAGRLWTNNWGSADVEIGRSSYRLESADMLSVSDSVLQDDGSWRVFSMLHYRRNKS
jgi:hypothetical protein